MSEDKKKIDQWTDEERRNVVGVFKILLEVDKRLNPQNYKLNNKKDI